MTSLREEFEKKKKEYTIQKRNDYNQTVNTLNKKGGVSYIEQEKLQGKQLMTIAKENNTQADHIHHYLRSKGKTWRDLQSPVNKKRVLRIDKLRKTLLTKKNYQKLIRAGLTDNDIRIFFHFLKKEDYEEYVHKFRDQGGE